MMSDDREHRIRQRAHEIWEHEGRPSGRDQEHWERATKDVDGGLDRSDLQRAQSSVEQRSQATVKSPEPVVPPGQSESQAAQAAEAKNTIERGGEKKAAGTTQSASPPKSVSAKKQAATKKPAAASKPQRNA